MVVLTGDSDDLPGAAVLRKARDVVVLVERGSPRSATEHLERMGIRPLRFETTATTEDAALLLASGHDASLIVGVGLHATLAEFLDRRRAGTREHVPDPPQGRARTSSTRRPCRGSTTAPCDPDTCWAPSSPGCWPSVRPSA